MTSNCCWAPVFDPGNTGEGLCSECWEHCTDEPEGEEENCEYCNSPMKWNRIKGRDICTNNLCESHDY